MAADDDGIAGAKSSLSLVTNLSVIFLVVLWLVPTIGLLVSSFRDRDAITASGWWKSPFPVEQNFAVGKTEKDIKQIIDLYDAWAEVSGLDRTDAMESYVKTVKSLIERDGS